MSSIEKFTYSLSHPEHYESFDFYPMQPEPYLRRVEDKLPKSWKIVRSGIWLNALVVDGYRLTFGRDVPVWLSAMRERVSFIDPNDVRAWTAHEDLVLMSVGPELLTLAWLRYLMSLQQASISAVLQSMSPAPRVRYLLTSKMLCLLDTADSLICGSRASEQALRKMQAAIPPVMRVSNDLPFSTPIIPFGVDTEQFSANNKAEARERLAVPAAGTIILALGRLSPTDRADPLPLLIAFSRLPQGPDVRLIIAGDDTTYRMRDALMQAAAQRGCGNRFSVISDPSSASKRDLLCAADIFVAHGDNIQEAFSVSLIEAMAAGLAVVATDWAGHREFIDDGENGLLVRTALSPLGDELPLLTAYAGPSVEQRLSASTAVDLKGLGDALQMLIASPEIRTRLGNEARAFIRSNCSWPKVIAQYDDLWYSQSAAKKRHAPQASTGGFVPVNRVFEDYASSSPAGTPMLASACREQEQQQIIAALGKDPRFNRDMFGRIVGYIGEAQGPVAQSEVLRYLLAANGTSRSNAEAHLARLIKYGVLNRSHLLTEMQ